MLFPHHSHSAWVEKQFRNALWSWRVGHSLPSFHIFPSYHALSRFTETPKFRCILVHPLFLKKHFSWRTLPIQNYGEIWVGASHPQSRACQAEYFFQIGQWPVVLQRYSTGGLGSSSTALDELLVVHRFYFASQGWPTNQPISNPAKRHCW